MTAGAAPDLEVLLEEYEHALGFLTGPQSFAVRAADLGTGGAASGQSGRDRRGAPGWPLVRGGIRRRSR